MSQTIQSITDAILARIPGAPLEDTVDTIKTGDANQPVTGIVTTFMATYDVLKQAHALGANFVITHEPTFYSHRDEVDWLGNDPVYQAKQQFIDEHKMVVWRFHDYWHRHRPDGIFTGVIKALGWEHLEPNKDKPWIEILPTTLDDLAQMFKTKLDIDWVRVVGNPAMMCQRAAILPGAGGGRWQIGKLAQKEIDVVICGEINEWEVSEYARDATALGLNKGLIVLGHAKSEDAGMEWLVEWLQPMVPGVPITHVPAGDAFHYV